MKIWDSVYIFTLDGSHRVIFTLDGSHRVIFTLDDRITLLIK